MPSDHSYERQIAEHAILQLRSELSRASGAGEGVRVDWALLSRLVDDVAVSLSTIVEAHAYLPNLVQPQFELEPDSDAETEVRPPDGN